MDQRAAWSAAGGVIVATSGTNAAAWAVGATAAGSHLPSWPAFIFGGMAVVGVLVTVTALLRVWPFHWLAVSSAELLDDCIRRGRDARARILYDELDEWQATHEAAEWTMYTSNRLDRYFPAIADHFQLMSGDKTNLSGQALLLNTISAKLKVLASARREQSS